MHLQVSKRGRTEMSTPVVPAWQRWTALMLLAAALCWPALLNRQPFLFSDTTAYIKGAATGIQKFLNRPSPWIDRKITDVATPALAATQVAQGAQLAEFESSPEKKGVLAGRSVYYGAFVLLAYEAGKLWAPVLLQGLLAAIAISVALTASKAEWPSSPLRSAGLVAILTIGTSLPFYVSTLMPDLLTGLAILLTASLLAFPVSGRARVASLSILCFATLSHSVNLLVMGGMLVACAILSLSLRASIRRAATGAVLVLAAVLVGLAGEMTFNAVVKRTIGQEPIRPPFIMARLIADGPGTEWLRDHCAQSSYVVCRYAANAGNGSSEDFLWSLDPAVGVFTRASKNERVDLSAEQFAFAKDVVSAYPKRVALNATRNFATQLTTIGLSLFNYSPSGVEVFAYKLPPSDFEELENTLAAAERFPTEPIATLQLLVLLVSLLVLVGWIGGRWRDAPRDLRMFVLLILLGVLANALVSGVLSIPNDRYQGRVIWLVPLLAILVSCLPAGAARRDHR